MDFSTIIFISCLVVLGCGCFFIDTVLVRNREKVLKFRIVERKYNYGSTRYLIEKYHRNWFLWRRERTGKYTSTISGDRIYRTYFDYEEALTALKEEKSKYQQPEKPIETVVYEDK